jgi:hypothetical protein
VHILVPRFESYDALAIDAEDSVGQALDDGAKPKLVSGALLPAMQDGALGCWHTLR